MTIIGILGAIGSGKSHAQLKQGLLYAEQRHKQLVCNFLVNEGAIYKYACLPEFSEKAWGGILMEIINFKYAIQWHLSRIFKFIPKPNKKKFKLKLPWIKRMIEGGGIIQIPNPKNLQALLIPESVVLLDEAGILLNAREFAKTPKELLADLAQSRKFGSDLIWCAQFDSQIDRQMKLLTQYFWHCKGGSIWDKKMRRPKLIYEEMHYFDADNYESWVNNPKARSNWIKTRFAYTIRTEEGILRGRLKSQKPTMDSVLT